MFDVEILHQKQSNLAALKGTFVKTAIETVIYDRCPATADILIVYVGSTYSQE